MAEVIVNHNAVSYTVENGVNKKGFKFNNPGNGTQRTFNIDQLKIDIGTMTGMVSFFELDTDEVNGYESPKIGRLQVIIPSVGAYITSGNLDLQALKIAGLNQLFLNKLEIEPLNADGSVKAEYV